MYLTKNQRLEFLVTVRNGIMLDGSLERFTTKTASAAGGTGHYSDEHIWAMDVYGNIYVRRGDAGRWHHSSFTRGQDVICAGEIGVRDGVLLRLNNGSGHYKPTADALHRACQRLAGDGVSFANAVVETVHPPAGPFPTAASAIVAANPVPLSAAHAFLVYDGNQFLASGKLATPRSVRY